MELALIVPVLLVLVAAAGDLARVFAARISIESAARSGALEASLHPASYVAGSACSTVSNRVMCAVLTESAGGAAAVAPADVSLTCLDTYYEYGRRRHHRAEPCTERLGNLVEVTVVGHVQLLTPILAPFTGGQAFDTTATATAQIAVRPSIAGTTATPAPTPGFTPLPLPTPTPEPGATPTPSPTAEPTPSPTPFCAPPVANFTVDPTSGRKGNIGHGTLFRFTDLSTTTPLCPLTWSWNFGDGGGAASTSTEMNPTHTYQTQSGQGNNPGAFEVVLIASNAGGSSSFKRNVTVTP